MSWLFSRALVEEFSAASCSDGEPSVHAKSTPTPETFFWPDKTTDHSRLSRYGTTSEPLTEDRGAELLTWFLAASRARTSAQQEKDPESTENKAGCGQKWPGSFAKYDHDSRSWKTHQFSLLGDFTEFSGTWPRWGLMRDGVCWEQMHLAPRNIESVSGYWQTPTTRDGKGQSGKGNRIKRGRNGRLHVANLCDSIIDIGRQDLVRSVTFRLKLMGWPIGWTNCAPLETAKFHKWQRQHGGF
jgi:hypothetical protein